MYDGLGLLNAPSHRHWASKSVPRLTAILLPWGSCTCPILGFLSLAEGACEESGGTGAISWRPPPCLARRDVADGRRATRGTSPWRRPGRGLPASTRAKTACGHPVDGQGAPSHR